MAARLRIPFMAALLALVAVLAATTATALTKPPCNVPNCEWCLASNPNWCSTCNRGYVTEVALGICTPMDDDDGDIIIGDIGGGAGGDISSLSDLSGGIYVPGASTTPDDSGLIEVPGGETSECLVAHCASCPLEAPDNCLACVSGYIMDPAGTDTCIVDPTNSAAPSAATIVAVLASLVAAAAAVL